MTTKLNRRQEAPAESQNPSDESSALRLMRDPALPVSIRALNRLSDGVKQRICRTLFPPALLVQFQINPVTWKGPDGERHIRLQAPAGSHTIKISASRRADDPDPFAYVELADNNFNAIDVILLVLNDPDSPRFHTDTNVEGVRTLFGTVDRNREEEERAMVAGLAPAQIRLGLRASGLALQQMETFLTLLGHRDFYVEPLTYADAWLFERRGFDYVRGRRLMARIHAEFQPGGRLHQALDGSTPFRQPEQWRTVRGRAWAIHDGVLAAIDERWDGVRMVKKVGHDAGVRTFPDAQY
jgi:hypothetical protein